MTQHTLHLGDCREIMQTLPEQSVNCCVTSPPYFGLRDYGMAEQIGLEPTPERFVADLVAVFREVKRVLRDDGTLWLNLGDSYASSKQLIGIPWRVAFALQSDGWYLRQDIIWHKPNPMPESVRDRCTKSHEYIFLLSKSARYWYDAEAIKEQGTGRAPGNKGPAKYANAYEQSEAEHHRTASGLEKPRHGYDMHNRRSVWTVTSQPYKGAHFATFPPTLVEPCILAGCPVGGTVLDPFSGSATTGQVALANARNYIGCELNPDYHELAQRRLDGAQLGLGLNL
jgi:DNA modification methylase